MNIYSISSLINFITCIILCLAIFSKEKKTKLDFLFIAFSFSAAFWSFGYFFWQLSDTSAEALIWSRIFMAGAISIGIFYLHFIAELLNLSSAKRAFLRTSDALFVIFLLLDLTPLLVKSVAPEAPFAFWPKPGIAFHFFLACWTFYVIYSTVLMYKGWRAAEGVVRLQLKQVLIGLVLGFAGGATNYFLWYGIRVLPVANILVSVYILFVFYAIVKYKMFNVKIIATEIFVLGLIATSVAQLFGNVLGNSYFQTVYIVAIMIAGIFLVRSVLTEVKQKDQLQVLSEQLKAMDAAKSEFLSVTSHQLRTPLTAIKGYASMLMEGDFGAMSDVQKQNVGIIYESSERLARLVADLLDLSRIESGRMEFDFAAVNLCEITDSVIAELAPKAKNKGLYLFFDNVNRSCPEIRADAEKLRQVVINLIDNAVKYTPSGGVTVQLHRVGDLLQFSVKDTGIGVNPEEKARLFEKFFRTTAANEVTREGTGLGIYVVKKIVEAHGGKIWFESEGVGKGTTFTFTLPIPAGKIVAERVKIDSLFTGA